MKDTRWKIVAASVMGTGHIAHNMPCQDAFKVCIVGNTLIAAVADGAGTAKRADEGSRFASDQCVALLEVELQACLPAQAADWRSLIEKVFHTTRTKLEELATKESAPLRDFSTTLSCVVVTDDWLVVGQIGDCAVIFGATDQSLELSILPQRGEYANETTMLTSQQSLQYLEVKIYQQPVQQLMLMSDGLLGVALERPSYTPYGPFCQTLLDFAAAATDEQKAHADLISFLVSTEVRKRTDDDLTLVLAVSAHPNLEQDLKSVSDEDTHIPLC